MHFDQAPRRLTFSFRYLSSLLIILSLACLASCGRNPSESTEIPVSIGYQPNVFSLPLFVMQDHDLLKPYGIRVVLRRYDGSSEMLDALISGEIDIAGSLSLPSAAAAELEKPNYLRLLSLSMSTKDRPATRFVVPIDSKLQGIRDLAGKSLGHSPPSSMTRLMAIESLRGAGVDPRTVTLVPLSSKVALEALVAHQVDALSCLEPTATIVVLTREARILDPAPVNTYIMNPLPGVGFFIRRGGRADRPEIIAAFRATLTTAITFVRSNEDGSRRLLAKWAGVTDPTIRDQMPMIDFLTPDELPDSTAKINSFLSFLHSHHELKSELDINQMLR